MTDDNRNLVITDGTLAGHPVHAVAWWAADGPPPPYVVAPRTT